ncbi:Cytochrome P450 2U1 [Cercospora beticola]|uniref:Cytochrome P450 2U1 n=1 Tax=Cercospora beticola TaxID=122368 RepID=A0A2G5HCV1_CERBT|nr:Cytochrome P450 2U1 [Cercospora beticola]PIA90370.1 Cytochrome P450 2U1 [Cercospora beticola]WPB08031.1 hypothetical protein RHO25_012695 [Cercospora beticola]
MAVADALGQDSPLATLALYASLITAISYIAYRTYFDPLSHVPGPLICRLTSLWVWIHSYLGDECRQIDSLHAKYGPVVRIAPNEVVFSEGEALGPIYSEKGGFLKSPAYANFDFEGHQTIFSARDPAHRAKRSKAVVPMFSTAAIRSNVDTIEGCIDQFVKRLQSEVAKARSRAKETGNSHPVDVLNLTRGLALDAVTSYLFGKSYDGCNEKTSRLSASMFVDSVVSFGRFFYLPNYLFGHVFTICQKLFPPSPEENESIEKVDTFTKPLTHNPPFENLYQTRLLNSGITPEETNIQMQDVIFAGTNTTGTNLALLLWNLTNHPSVLQKLHQELHEASTTDPSTLPYLNATIKETLRLSMANPTRFPRIVPPSGWTYTSPSTSKTYHLPSGTQVGLQPWTLHFNPSVFPDPHTFNPDRWLDPTKEMLRDWIPFNIGARQCIARNLAMTELLLTARAAVKEGVLRGARVVRGKIEVVEWFNAKIVGKKVELVWD